MDLWIRSQDKEDLKKAEHIGVFNEKIYINGYEENGYCIGTYKSKERALEVLDEIQEAQLGNYHYRCPSNVKVSNNENTIVYQMPIE